MAGWTHVNRCNNCGHITHNDGISKYTHPSDPCPDCGKINWKENIVARKVPSGNSSWWNPLSWGTYKWKFLEKGSDTP